MKTILFTRPLVRILAVLGFLVVLAVVVWLLSGLPAPREQDRVATADGAFSIIKPRDWDSRVLYNSLDSRYSAAIEITPAKSVGRMQRFCVSQFREAPDQRALQSTFTASRFQDRDAWLFAKMVKRDFIFRLIFERGGQWYEISLRLPSETDVPESDWWPYVNSFRAQAPGSATNPNDQTRMPNQ